MNLHHLEFWNTPKLLLPWPTLRRIKEKYIAYTEPYTDASKSNKGEGAAIVGSNLTQKYTLLRKHDHINILPY